MTRIGGYRFRFSRRPRTFSAGGLWDGGAGLPWGSLLLTQQTNRQISKQTKQPKIPVTNTCHDLFSRCVDNLDNEPSLVRSFNHSRKPVASCINLSGHANMWVQFGHRSVCTDLGVTRVWGQSGHGSEYNLEIKEEVKNSKLLLWQKRKRRKKSVKMEE